MEQHRNSGSSLLSSIMGPGGSTLAKVRETGKPVTAADVTDQRPSAKTLAAVRSEASIRKGPQVPRGAGSYGRAKRRARKAGRVQRVEKLNKGKADLQRKREQLLDTAAAFARIWFAGPPVQQKRVGVSAYERIVVRVQKQAENLIATGKAKDEVEAIKQIEDSMRETIRQHDVLLAQKAIVRGPKVAELGRSRYDPKTGSGTYFVEGAAD